MSSKKDSVELDSFGTFFSYEVSTVTWDRSLVDSLYDANGITDPKLRPFAPNDSSAFGRTMRIMQDRGSNPSARAERRSPGDPRPTVIRQPLDPGKVIVFTKIGKASLNATYRINRGTRMQDKEAMEYMNTVVWTPSGLEFANDYLKDEIKKEYDNQRTYNHQDVRASILKLITVCRPLPLKGNTALFFPKEYIDRVNAISNILQGLECDIVRLDIAATEKSRDDLIKHFMASVKADMDEAEKDLIERLTNDVETRDGTWDKRRASLKDIRGKIDYFTGLLNCASETLVERLDSIQQKLKQAMLTGTTKETEYDRTQKAVAQKTAEEEAKKEGETQVTVEASDPFKDLTA